MAYELKHSPVDTLTGIVWPVYVTPEDFSDDEIHSHHANFNKRRRELQGLGGKSVRLGRIEYLPINLHHQSYKGSLHSILGGPEVLPKKPDGQFCLASLLISRVIPRDAIDLKSDDPLKPKRLNNKEHEFLSSPQVINVDDGLKRGENLKRYEIGRFFIDYVLQEAFIGNVVKQKQREKFLNTEDPKRIRELGNGIIQSAVREALRPVGVIYREAKSEGMVGQGKPDLLTSVLKILPEYEFVNFYPKIKSILDPSHAEDGLPLQTDTNGIKLAA